jgi:hypothetical protein
LDRYIEIEEAVCCLLDLYIEIEEAVGCLMDLCVKTPAIVSVPGSLVKYPGGSLVVCIVPRSLVKYRGRSVTDAPLMHFRRECSGDAHLHVLVE